MEFALPGTEKRAQKEPLFVTFFMNIVLSSEYKYC